MNILASRDYYGVGDWLMTLTVLKHVNIQYPDVNIDILIKHHTPIFIKEIVGWFEGKWSIVDSISRDYDKLTGHIIYDENDKPLIESMIDNFNKATGLSVVYDDSIYSRYNGLKYIRKDDEPIKLPNEYIVMPSMGRVQDYIGKEWGYDNFQKLSSELSKYINIVQLGEISNPSLDCEYRYPGVKLPIFNYIIENALSVVSLVNGLMVYSTVHGKKTFVIYCGNEANHMSRYNFPNQIPICTGNFKDVSCSIIRNLGL